MPDPQHLDGPAGASALAATGMDPQVAEELHRRIEIVDAEIAADDPARQPFAGAQLAGYVAVTLLCCLVGLLLVAL